jgi:hypothetical protein
VPQKVTKRLGNNEGEVRNREILTRIGDLRQDCGMHPEVRPSGANKVDLLEVTTNVCGWSA